MVLVGLTNTRHSSCCCPKAAAVALRLLACRFGIKLDDKTLSKMFKQFDSNNDGDVDIKEFVRYFERSEFEAINESKRASPVDIKRMPKPAALKQQKFKSNQRVIASKAIDALKTKIRRRMVVDSSMVKHPLSIASI